MANTETLADVLNTGETVVIPMDEYKWLLMSDAWLEALEEAGVNEWEGIQHAHEIMSGGKNDK